MVYVPDEPTGRIACKAAFDRVADLEDIMSDYRRDSELMRLCAKSGQGPVKVSPDLFRVLAYGQQVSERSDGAFDVTVGPVVALWRQARKSHLLPPDDQIKDALSRVGWRYVKLDDSAQTVELLKPGMKLDLGGIAKGYAGDEAIRILRIYGITSALFEAGGDIVVSDPPPGKAGWEVELPAGEVGAPKTFIAKNQGVSTSGDTVQYVEINGRRYSHVVDPHTGLGLSEHFIATVVAPRGMESDALSKVPTVMGPERGIPVVKSFGATCWVGKAP